MNFLKLTKNELYLVSAFTGFLIALIVLTFYMPNYYESQEPVSLDVPRGTTLNKVIDTLYDLGVVPNKTNMKIAAWISGTDNKLKAGHYELPNGLNYLQLCDLLSKGIPLPQKLITIQEGIWQEKLAQLLHKGMGISVKEFMKLSRDRKFIRSLGLKNVNYLEGYLLPNTYYFYEGSTAKEILIKLSKKMQQIFSEAKVIERMKELHMNEKQILTLASIIDGESNIVEEFKKISGVYHNRLKRGMLLQADPTIQYIVRHRRRKVNKIYYKDLAIDSPYNTYKYRGLPPAPINNPGKDAIMAALYPGKNNYLYFVADGSGGHVFSKTISQHLRNVQSYRGWRNSQRHN
ncbi:putative aminodeoxychorismate lyase [bacterium BMS3Abin04]|nr:putative aminodeoxychorismate lyase [bacterium BMS3Abin04]